MLLNPLYALTFLKLASSYLLKKDFSEILAAARMYKQISWYTVYRRGFTVFVASAKLNSFSKNTCNNTIVFSFST